jgi:DNA-directed RNA polymerase specialized sigma24 family protein
VTVPLRAWREGDETALERRALAALDERKSRVNELRFVGGLTVDQVAPALHVWSKTVSSDWEFARAWLQRIVARGRT